VSTFSEFGRSLIRYNLIGDRMTRMTSSFLTSVCSLKSSVVDPDFCFCFFDVISGSSESLSWFPPLSRFRWGGLIGRWRESIFVQLVAILFHSALATWDRASKFGICTATNGFRRTGKAPRCLRLYLFLGALLSLRLETRLNRSIRRNKRPAGLVYSRPLTDISSRTRVRYRASS